MMPGRNSENDHEKSDRDPISGVIGPFEGWFKVRSVAV